MSEARGRSSRLPSRFRDVEGARAAHGEELVDRLISSVFLSDEPADRLVEAFGRLPGGEGWRMLDEALAHGAGTVSGAPPELETLLGPVLEPPAWVDHDLVEAGAVAWWRVGGLAQLLALTAGSLAYGYGAGSLARPLAMTGRLTRMAPRRLGETARWVQVTTRPGALRPGGPGVGATVRLRLMHALIRSHLRHSGDWDVANWGEPLSVGDTVATGVSGFFVVPLHGLRDLGVHYAPEEVEAIAHLWSWITFLMGVPSEHLPGSAAEAEAFTNAAMAIDSGPIAESPELLRALLFHGLAFERTLPGPAAALARRATGHALGALARRWMGDERADELGAPDTALKHLVPLLRPLTHARSLARAGGLLGSDERVATFELFLVRHTMAAAGVAPVQLQPEQVEREPVLGPAA